MAELVVIGFDDLTEAENVLSRLRGLGKEYLIDLEDAVVVTRDNGACFANPGQSRTWIYRSIFASAVLADCLLIIG